LQACPFPRGIPEELELVALEVLDVDEVLEPELLVVEPLELLVVEEELPVVALLELLVVDELVALPPCPLELVAICTLELLDVVAAAPPVSAGPVNVKWVVQAPTPTLTPKSAHPSRQYIFIRTSRASRSREGQGPGQSPPSTGGSWAPSRQG
jgi:hypothetical protein